MNQNLDFSRSPSPSTALPVDLGALKMRQQAMWASGDFSVIGTTLQIVGETLCEAADLGAGSRVLDPCRTSPKETTIHDGFCEWRRALGYPVHS